MLRILTVQKNIYITFEGHISLYMYIFQNNEGLLWIYSPSVIIITKATIM